MPRSVLSQMSGLGGWKVTFYATAQCTPSSMWMDLWVFKYSWSRIQASSNHSQFSHAMETGKCKLRCSSQYLMHLAHITQQCFLMPLQVCEVYYQFLSLAVQKGNSSIARLQVCEVCYQFFEFGCSKRKQFYCAAYKVENVVRQSAHSASLTFSHILISFWTQ